MHPQTSNRKALAFDLAWGRMDLPLLQQKLRGEGITSQDEKLQLSNDPLRAYESGLLSIRPFFLLLLSV
jgi:hypothetical protein